MSNLSTAICSFCSREDTNVKVVCAKYCLICRRCQLLPATRHLIYEYSRIDHVSSQNVNANNDIPIEPMYDGMDFNSERSDEVIRGYCPLCFSKMSKNMYQVVRNLLEDKDDQDINTFTELDLGKRANQIVEFLLNFRHTYGSIGIEIKLDNDNTSEALSSALFDGTDSPERISSALTKLRALVALTSPAHHHNASVSKNTPMNHNFEDKDLPVPSIEEDKEIDLIQENLNVDPMNTNPQRKKVTTAPIEKKRNLPSRGGNMTPQVIKRIGTGASNPPVKDSRVDIYAAVPSVLSYHEGLSLFAECLVLIWQSSIRGCEESLLSTLKKIVIRKKATNRSNDFRMKSFIDFVVTSNGLANIPSNSNKSSVTLLIGKLIGITPKIFEHIRPVLASITTTIHILCYCGDRAISSRSKEIYDSVRCSPSPIEFKTKIDKFSSTRLIPIRKALQILEYLISIEEPHWCMSPLSVACITVGSKGAWEPDSISKLIHLIMFIIQGDQYSQSNDTCNKKSQNNPPGNQSNFNHKKQTVSKTNHSIITEDLDNDDYDVKDKEIEYDNELPPLMKLPRQTNRIRSSSLITSNSTKINTTRQYGSYNSNNKKDSNNHNSHQKDQQSTILKRLQSVSRYATEYWNCLINDTWKDQFESKSIGTIIHHKDDYSPNQGINQSNVKSNANNDVNKTNEKQSGNVLTNNGLRGRGGIYSLNTGSYSFGSPSSKNQSSGGYVSSLNSNPDVFSPTSSDHLENTSYYQSAMNLSRNTGKGILSSIDFHKAFVLIPPDLMITPSELSLICCAAWEAEYDRVLQLQVSIELTNNRRPAVKGVFNEKHAKLTFMERLIMKRIISWYHTVYLPHYCNDGETFQSDEIDESSDSDNDTPTNSSPNHSLSSTSNSFSSHRSILGGKNSDSKRPRSYNTMKKNPIDWNLIKELAKERLLPFTVPESLQNKSAAELNYHYLQIIIIDENRRQQEELEDKEIWNVQYPYRPLPYALQSKEHDSRPSSAMKDRKNHVNTNNQLQEAAALSHGRVMGKRLDIVHSPKQKIRESDIMNAPISSEMIEAMQREKYLSSQTLGENNSMSASTKELLDLGSLSNDDETDIPSIDPVDRYLKIPDENLSSAITKNEKLNKTKGNEKINKLNLSLKSPNAMKINMSSPEAKLTKPNNRKSVTIQVALPLAGDNRKKDLGSPSLLVNEPLRSPEMSSLFLQEQHLSRPSTIFSPVKSLFSPSNDLTKSREENSSSRPSTPQRTESIAKSSLTTSSSELAIHRTPHKLLNILEGSCSIRTNPKCNREIPGSRGLMYPSSLYETNQSSKLNIHMADIISIHPNLLTKANLLKSNELMIDPKDGRLIYGSPPSLIDILTDPMSNLKGGKKSVDGMRNKEYQIANGEYHTSNTIINNRDTILKNHNRRISFQASAVDLVADWKVNENNQDEIFYQPLKTITCPPLHTFLKPPLQIKRSDHHSEVDNSDHNSQYSLGHHNESGIQSYHSNHRSSVAHKLLVKPILHEISSEPVHSSDHQTESLAIKQDFESYALEFNEYIKELQNRISSVPASELSHSNHVFNNNKQIDNNLSKSHIEARVAIDTFLLKNISMNIASDFNYIIDHFFNRNVRNLKYIYLEGLNLGSMGSLLINNSRLCDADGIEHVSISYNNLADRGVISILEPIAVKSKSKKSLTYLSMKNNDITFANGGLNILNQFTALTFLDLSHNRISLDVMKQQTIFSNLLSEYSQLRYLSLAFNTIQDKGLELLVKVIENNCIPDVEIIDVAKCSLTGNSIPNIQDIFNNSKLTKLRLFILQQNIFTNDQIKRLKYPDRLNINNKGVKNQIQETKSKAIISVTTNEEGFLVMYQEPFHRIVRVILDGEHKQLDEYIQGY